MAARAPGREDESVDADEPDSNNVYMACLYRGRTLGMAWYDQDADEVSVFQAPEDEEGPYSMQTLQLAKLQANPRVIYTSSKADEAFIERLKQPADVISSQEYVVRLEKSSLFQTDSAWRILQMLRLNNMPKNLSSQDMFHFLNTLMNLQSLQQVCAAGALLAILHQEGLLNCSAEDPAENEHLAAGGSLRLGRLSEVSPRKILMVNPVAVNALSICQEECHPSAMGIGASKEGLSVFGVLCNCVTRMGRRLLRLWFLRPIIDLDAIAERQDAIETLMRQFDTTMALREILRRIKDAPRILSRMQASLSSLTRRTDFLLIAQSIASLFLLRDALSAAGLHARGTDGRGGAADSAAVRSDYPSGQLAYNAQAGPVAGSFSLHAHALAQSAGRGGRAGARPLGLVRRAVECIGEPLASCHSLLAGVLDLEQGEGWGIARGVSPRLDALKDDFQALPTVLTQVMQRELSRIPRELSLSGQDRTWSIIYMPQIGFMVKVSRKLTADLEEALPDYVYGFEGAGPEAEGLFYSCAATAALNRQHGDLLHKIHDLEGSIFTEVVRRLGRVRADLAAGIAVAAEADCLASLAAAARAHNLTRPTLTAANVLHIKSGRHLLAELVAETFIPNDTAMAEDIGRVQIVTGPNVAGKSVYAQQVALIAYLAHVGSFVPAESATVGLIDAIFTCIPRPEGLALPQSSFLLDLSQVAAMLRRASGRSLCVLDEFGKGTLAGDGAGLLCAVLDRFARCAAPPRVVACTHFSEVLNTAYLPRTLQLSFLTMDVLVEAANPELRLAEKVVFLYKLVPGYVAPSFGVHCARMVECPAEVLQRAEEVIKLRCEKKIIAPITTPAQRARDARCMQLVQALVKLNLDNQKAVDAFLNAAIQPRVACCGNSPLKTASAGTNTKTKCHAEL